jgi:CdiI immunity protein
MNYEQKFFDLSQLFGGYLNQNFHHIYIWEDKKPTYQPLIRKYKTESERVKKTIEQLKDIMKIGKGSDEEDWGEILDKIGLGYYPPGDNLTYEEWLEDVLKILEEPMEETLRHWIPERT